MAVSTPGCTAPLSFLNRNKAYLPSAEATLEKYKKRLEDRRNAQKTLRDMKKRALTAEDDEADGAMPDNSTFYFIVRHYLDPQTSTGPSKDALPRHRAMVFDPVA